MAEQRSEKLTAELTRNEAEQALWCVEEMHRKLGVSGPLRIAVIEELRRVLGLDRAGGGEDADG